MSGYYDRDTMDACYEEFQDHRNDRIYDYVMDREPHMRPNRIMAPFLSAGQQPDFYGPMVGSRVTRESFLQGRGHCVNKCPDCDVVYLPSSVFPNKPSQSVCDRIDLEAMYTRLPRSCNGLNETDIYPYFQMPGAWEKGYSGYNSVVHTQLQSRMPPAQPYRVLQPGQETYGSYESSPFMKPYM